MTRSRRNRKGFTLVEVISASVILCGAVMIVGSIGTQAMIGTKLNRRYEMASSLIDGKLALIDYVGIESFIEAGELNGASEDYGYMFSWEVQTEYQEIDSLYLVRVIVSWIEGQRPYSVTIDTMFDGVTPMDEE